MARTKELIKRSEARIITYILNADKHRRRGDAISEKLNIDYIYVMKLLGQMYNKGWLKTHKYDGVIYFALTLRTPIEEAKKRLIQGGIQCQLRS